MEINEKRLMSLLGQVKREVKRLEKTTVGALVSDVEDLKNELSSLTDEFEALKQKLSNYENHTHEYQDETISDTQDGTGTSTTESKNTTGVNSAE